MIKIKNNMKLFILNICLVSSLFASSNTFAFTESKISISDDIDEVSTYIDDGKWLVVKVWSHTCSICLSTMKETNDYAINNLIPNTHIIGISADGVDNPEAGSLEEKFGESYTALLETNSSFQNYVTDLSSLNDFLSKDTTREVFAFPTYLIYSPEGKLIAMQAGDIKPSEIKKYIMSKEKN